jgi:hypothetical protein
MNKRIGPWTWLGAGLLATALLATLALFAWLHGLPDGDFSVVVDDEVVRVHGLHGGGAFALALAGVAVAFVICLLVLPLGLLIVVAVPLIVVAALAFGLLLPLALLLAVLAAPLLLVALLVRWVWRRSEKHPSRTGASGTTIDA